MDVESKSPEPLQHRSGWQSDEVLDNMVERAVSRYGVLITDNIDLSRIPLASLRARVVANALMERGDLRAYLMGRELLAVASGR